MTTMRSRSTTFGLAAGVFLVGAFALSCSDRTSRRAPVWGLDGGEETSAPDAADSDVDASAPQDASGDGGTADSSPPSSDAAPGDTTPPDDATDVTSAPDTRDTAGPRADTGSDTGSADAASDATGSPDASDGGVKTCDRNQECGANEVCCPDRQGTQIRGICEKPSNCSVGSGGFCKGAGDCNSSERCCDFGGSSRRLCVQPDRCPTSSGQPCDYNSDCPNKKRCCPRPPGQSGPKSGRCDSDCPLTDGLCRDNSSCSGSDECCDRPFEPGKVCAPFCP